MIRSISASMLFHQEMVRRDVTLLILLDFTVAFATIHHGIFLGHLSVMGLRDTICEVIQVLSKEYLSEDDA